MGLLLADLGVTKTHSRPYVSNDNPYSESQFKTMKYCPQFPSRFGSAEDGRLFCCGFFDYYNFHHRHSGIGLMTPADVHYGRAEQLTTARRQILLEAQQAHPERFVRGTPQPPVLPPQAWINPPLEKTTLHDAAQAPLAAASIPGVPPFSASRNKILIDVDVDRTDLMLFFTLNREDFSFVIHLDRQPRTSRRREAQTGSRARSGSRSERTLDAVEHSRTLMEWWPFLIFHRGGLRIKVINNTSRVSPP